MIILSISDTTLSIYYFRFIEDILHPFPKVFNLGRLISQKHKDTDRKITQQQPQTTRKLGESDN